MAAPNDRWQGEHEDEGSWLDSHPMRLMGRRPAAGPDDVVRDVQRDKVFAGLGLTPQREQHKPDPRRFGRYIVLDVLGQGGMGTVLKGYDEELNRQVAIKVLQSGPTERQGRRLKREAQALARLSHPNVVPVFEVAEAEGQVFVAMELVEGKTLWERQDEEPRHGWKECVEVYLQAGRGLAAAHAKGLVHRDFKPGNAIIDDEGRVRVLDFGLVRGVALEGEDEPSAENGREGPLPKDDALEATLTRTGQAMGTPAYMPLEQLDGRPADARSDQFSFCVSLYEAVYGERPFEGSSKAQLAVSIGDGRVRPAPAGTKVPAKLRAILLRGLAAKPEQRWTSMEALLTELRRLITAKARRWLALGVAGGMTAIGVGIGQYAEVGFRCAGANAQLEGIWDNARQEEVKAAILGTELSYAPGTWERVKTRLDDYTRAWTDKHIEVCEATRVSQEQSEEAMDLRMGCLRERKTALNAAVKVLAQADEQAVEKAVDVVVGLKGLARCDNVDLLGQQRQRVPPPEDPQVAQEVEALRDQLADIKVEENAGHYAEALEQVEPIVERAKTLEYAPLLAEAMLRRGLLRHEIAEHANAEQDLELAYARAVEHGHDAVAAEAANGLTAVVSYNQARHEQGLWWGKTALPLSKGTNAGPHAVALLQNNIGLVLSKQGRLEKALNHHQRALAILEEVLGLNHPHVALSLNNIGIVLTEQGKLDEALTHSQRALSIWEEALGPNHPRVANSLTNLGNVLRTQGKLEEALTHYQRALSIWKEALGPNHPSVALSLNNIGHVLREQGKFEEALTHNQRTLAIWEEAVGPNHPGLAHPLNNIGIVLYRQGRLEEALTHLQRALAIQEEVLGPTHPNIAHPLNNIGNVLKDQGRLEEALTHYQRALAIWEEVLGPTHPNIADSLNNIGIVLSEQGTLEEALTYDQRALAIREEVLGPNHPSVATSLGNIGFTLSEQGRLEEALTHHQRALAIKEEALGPEHPSVAYALVGLAKVALKMSNVESAREHAERAIAIRQKADVAPVFLAEARFVLARVLWHDCSQRSRARELAEHARDGWSNAEAGDQETKEYLIEVEAWLTEHRVR